MAREITTHQVNELNESLRIIAEDEPGHGGACHEYTIRVPLPDGTVRQDAIMFQKGPIEQAGVNGISNEALLAIVADRLAGFQSWKYACRENALALTKIQEAMMWLERRTRERLSRGVEGTDIV